MKNRPTVLILIAILLWSATAVATVTGLSLLAPGTPLDRIWDLNRPAYAAFSTHAGQSGAILLLVGFAASAAATGLWRGRRWAWLLAIAIFSINALGDLVSLVITRDWLKGGLGLVIDAFFLFLLVWPNMRAFFARPA
jgi:hypothetical protein